MAIDNISNATISLTDYKTEQKVQSAASVQQVKPVETNAVTAKTYTDKQDGAREEEKRDAQANANRLKSILNETDRKSVV